MAFSVSSLIKSAFTLSHSPKPTMAGDCEKVTPEPSRALRSQNKQCDDIPAMEPNWQGQWRLLKYV
ncbi:hypothetical protein [Neptunomonas japonica]|uniref:hypothetical protein n=1 Tax=Neptunomonas japonica TaxID=417574 RepID=UPI00041C2D52|nr:hypothetical protein [Neptunomonas japonica]